MGIRSLYEKYMYGTPGMGEGTQGLFGQGGQQSGGLIDFNKMNNQQGGLLSNIPQSALLGSALFGQGMQGKDPFSALLPAVTQTAQLQKLMTPKKGFRILTESEKQSVPGIDMTKTYQIDTGTNKISQLSGTGTNVTVNTPRPETSEEKKIGAVYGDEFGAINKSGNLANLNDGTLDILSQLNESAGLKTGSFGELRTSAQKVAEEFGFDPGLQDTTVAEMVGSVTGGLVLDGLQKLSGSISDGERAYVQSTTPGLSTTREGNRYLLQIRQRQNELAKEYSNVANDWVSRNGGLSKKDSKLGSWGSYKQQWHKDNPLINPDMKKKISALSRTTDTEFSNNIVTRKNGNKYVYLNGSWEELIN